MTVLADLVEPERLDGNENEKCLLIGATRFSIDIQKARNAYDLIELMRHESMQIARSKVACILRGARTILASGVCKSLTPPMT